MRTRRDMLAFTAGAVAARTVLLPIAARAETTHPDAEILDLCSRLADMRLEWQMLYDQASVGAGVTTEADHAWADYSRQVWPRTVATPGCCPVDWPAKLAETPASTPEGQQAKAAAILAIMDASAYLHGCGLPWGGGEHHCDLARSLLMDVVGMSYRKTGGPKRRPAWMA